MYQVGSSIRYAFGTFRELTWMEVKTKSKKFYLGKRNDHSKIQLQTLTLKPGISFEIKWSVEFLTPSSREDEIRTWIEHRFSYIGRGEHEQRER